MNFSSIEDDDDYDVDQVYHSKYPTSHTKFRLPTIISSDSLNETNVNSNERLALKNLLTTQIEDYIQKTREKLENDPYLEEIKILSHKYYKTPLSGDDLKI